MPTAAVNVKYVNPPKEGGTWWSVKTDGGAVYFRKAPIDTGLQGKLCNLTYDVGKDDFKKILNIEPASPTAVKMNGGNGHKNEEDIAVLALVKSFIEAGKVTDVQNV